MYDNRNYRGKYSADEVSKLRHLRMKHGNNWKAIASELGRSSASVKDRCRLLNENCKRGGWLKEEEDRLAASIYQLAKVLPGEQVTKGISWGDVAQRVGSRSEKQCRAKWLNYLNWKHTSGVAWTKVDDIQLICRLSMCSLVDECDVDWAAVARGWPACRSPHWLRGKWWNLKHKLPQYGQDAPLREACQLLYNSQPLNLIQSTLVELPAATLSITPELSPTAAASTSMPNTALVKSTISIPTTIKSATSVDQSVCTTSTSGSTSTSSSLLSHSSPSLSSSSSSSKSGSVRPSVPSSSSPGATSSNLKLCIPAVNFAAIINAENCNVEELDCRLQDLIHSAVVVANTDTSSTSSTSSSSSRLISMQTTINHRRHKLSTTTVNSTNCCTRELLDEHVNDCCNKDGISCTNNNSNNSCSTDIPVVTVEQMASIVKEESHNRHNIDDHLSLRMTDVVGRSLPHHHHHHHHGLLQTGSLGNLGKDAVDSLSDCETSALSNSLNSTLDPSTMSSKVIINDPILSVSGELLGREEALQ